MKNVLRSTLFLLSVAINFGFATNSSLLRIDDTVPPDLGKEVTTILLLETPRKKVNKDMQEVFEKNYSGIVEMIDQVMLNSGQYKDTKKYRYYLETGITFQEARGWGNTRQPATFNYSYSLKDRQTGLSYGPSNASDAWLSLLKRYVKKMEETWKENQKK
jgi:hypothetical protein